MEFQRFSVKAGTFLARDGRLLPLNSVRVSRICEILSPRTSGRGYHSTDMPPSALNLFLILALCHTVRVEQHSDVDSDAHSQSGASVHSAFSKSLGVLERAKTKGLDKIKGLRKKRDPPKRAASILRRASAMQSAEEAVSSIRQGIIISGEGYDYQVSMHDWLFQNQIK